MNEAIQELKQCIPEWAKDARINLENVIGKNPLNPEMALGIVHSTFLAEKRYDLASIVAKYMDEQEVQTSKQALATMAMTNSWYGYGDLAGNTEIKSANPQFRMQAYANHGGGDPLNFEAYALAVSIVGKCRTCVSAHVTKLKEQGQISIAVETGRITAIASVLAKVA